MQPTESPPRRRLRRHYRLTKALRRLRKDRNQHYRDLLCLCWGVQAEPVPIHELERSLCRYGTTARHRAGRTFTMFADTPKACSKAAHGCGNPRRQAGSRGEQLTVQERRALAAATQSLREEVF